MYVPDVGVAVSVVTVTNQPIGQIQFGDRIEGTQTVAVVNVNFKRIRFQC